MADKPVEVVDEMITISIQFDQLRRLSALVNVYPEVGSFVSAGLLDDDYPPPGNATNTIGHALRKWLTGTETAQVQRFIARLCELRFPTLQDPE